MADKFEMSLDNFMKSNEPRRGESDGRRGRGGRGSQGSHQRNFRRSGGSGRVHKGRGRGGIARSYSQGDANSAWKHDLFEKSGPSKISDHRTFTQASMVNTKLIISNLNYGVSDSDIHHLFTELGPLKKATVHYDKSGRSLGTADVIFERRKDAIEAMIQYNGVHFDGRVMNIQLTTSEIPSSVRSTSGMKAIPKYLNRNTQKIRKAEDTIGRPAERGRYPSNQRKLPTAEELDTELEAYRAEEK